MCIPNLYEVSTSSFQKSRLKFFTADRHTNRQTGEKLDAPKFHFGGIKTFTDRQAQDNLMNTILTIFDISETLPLDLVSDTSNNGACLKTMVYAAPAPNIRRQHYSLMHLLSTRCLFPSLRPLWYSVLYYDMVWNCIPVMYDVPVNCNG